MTTTRPHIQTLPTADPATLELVRFAIGIAVGDEDGVRLAAEQVARAGVPHDWVEELLLQSSLFVGFPRALNATREWRRASGVAAPDTDEGERLEDASYWRERGEVTCEIVYGAMYEQLRTNIRTLHPALDAWMIVDGYGKILGRPELDLARRELCIVATCAVLRQERQLHSHLHGAVHAGAATEAVEAVLTLCEPWLPPDHLERYRRLWSRVRSRS